MLQGRNRPALVLLGELIGLLGCVVMLAYILDVHLPVLIFWLALVGVCVGLISVVAALEATSSRNVR
jgi:Na+-driven multidrug efflux pump